MLGVFGGTFDPIHYGHLRAALEVCQRLSLNELRFIPAYQPVHRVPPVASIEHRVAMLELAIQGIPQFQVDKREIARGGPSYTVDTLMSLRQEFPETPLCCLVGMDAFSHITTWHRWQKLLDLAHLVVLQRPGAMLPKTTAIEQLLTHRVSDVSLLSSTKQGFIWIEPITLLDISATAIRQQLALGQTPYFLLPDNVLQYIHRYKVFYQ